MRSSRVETRAVELGQVEFGEVWYSKVKQSCAQLILNAGTK